MTKLSEILVEENLSIDNKILTNLTDSDEAHLALILTHLKSRNLSKQDNLSKILERIYRLKFIADTITRLINNNILDQVNFPKYIELDLLKIYIASLVVEHVDRAGILTKDNFSAIIEKISLMSTRFLQLINPLQKTLTKDIFSDLIRLIDENSKKYNNLDELYLQVKKELTAILKPTEPKVSLAYESGLNRNALLATSTSNRSTIAIQEENKQYSPK